MASGTLHHYNMICVVIITSYGMDTSSGCDKHNRKTTHIMGAMITVLKAMVHVVNKEIIYVGMVLGNFRVPMILVDALVATLSKLIFRDLTKYGIRRPEEGPFALKAKRGKAPIIDVGTIEKIRNGMIKVLPAISKIENNNVTFNNGQMHQFDDIVFATGYRTSNTWVKDNGSFFGNDGMPKNKYPTHWKGENGLYCAGFSRRGLAGVSMMLKPSPMKSRRSFLERRNLLD